MVYWKLNLGIPLGFLETWIGMGRIRLYFYDDDSCCLDFVSGVMVLDTQSCSEEAFLHLNCFRRDRQVMKRRYGPSPGHLSGASAFESHTWVPTMTTIIKRLFFFVFKELILVTFPGSGGFLHVTSIFPRPANLKVQVLSKGSMFCSSLWVFVCFHRRRTGSLAIIIALKAFCLKKYYSIFLFFFEKVP